MSYSLMTGNSNNNLSLPRRSHGQPPQPDSASVCDILRESEAAQEINQLEQSDAFLAQQTNIWFMAGENPLANRKCVRENRQFDTEYLRISCYFSLFRSDRI